MIRKNANKLKIGKIGSCIIRSDYGIMQDPSEIIVEFDLCYPDRFKNPMYH